MSASIGVSVMRNVALAALAKTVFTRTGRSTLSSRAMMPALAAVSPKRESGPWKRAAARPAYRRGTLPSAQSVELALRSVPPKRYSAVRRGEVVSDGGAEPP